MEATRLEISEHTVCSSAVLRCMRVRASADGAGAAGLSFFFFSSPSARAEATEMSAMRL